MIKTESILQDLLIAFRTIKKTNQSEAGKYYESNIGDVFFDWSERPVPDEITTEAILQDISTDFDNTEQVASYHQRTDLFNVLLYSANGDDSLKELRKYERDVFRCLGKHNPEFLNKYQDTAIKPITIEKGMKKADKTIAGSLIKFSITYTTEPFLIGETEY
jgi:hypothetical protein